MFVYFDGELRVPWLEAKGDPLNRLDAVIDWEGFRRLLMQALAKSAKGPGGRPANDPVKMFKLLVVQRYYNLSDEQKEYQVSGRLAFQQFAGWTVAHKVPDTYTLWDFREALVRADMIENWFEQFAQQLRVQGLLAQKSKLVDASFVDVLRQRNTRAENAVIQRGGVPDSGADRTRLRFHEPVHQRISPALHWVAAQRDDNWSDQPDLQPHPIRTDPAIEAAATERRLKKHD